MQYLIYLVISHILDFAFTLDLDDNWDIASYW